MDYNKLGRKNSKKFRKSSEIFKMFHNFQKNSKEFCKIIIFSNFFEKNFKIVQNFQKKILKKPGIAI